MRRLALLSLSLLLLASGCVVSDLSLEETTVGGGSWEEPATDLPSGDPDEVVDAALADLSEFWDEQMPELYDTAFEPLTGGFVPYGPATPVPQCGPSGTSYQEVAGNAFYCPDDDLIAWDRTTLIPDLAERFGPLTVGIVMAHEYAHAAQVRAGVRAEPVTIELQADCFAGAWVTDAGDRSDLFATGGGALDQAIGGFLELRDNVGVDALDPNAHGSGFDRVSAFQDGFDDGGQACTGYEEDPPPVVAIGFLSLQDLEQGGNLPLPQLIPLLTANLEAFFADAVESAGGEWDPVDGLAAIDPARDVVDCGADELSGGELERASFYCVPDDTIYIDSAELVPQLAAIGDFAFGGEVARQYAYAAQAKSGILDRVADTDLHADCAAGAFSGAVYEGDVPGVADDDALALSPGDLDEVLIAFLAFGGGEATAFDRTTAFRTGFLEGYDACELFL